MGRMLCVVAVLAVQFLSEVAQAEPVRNDVPVVLKGLSPGRLKLALDAGGGDGSEKPPLEPGKMVAEALMGLPAYLVFVLAISPLLLVEDVHPLAVAVVSRAALLIGLPAITAFAQTLIGNSSDRTRVRFLPAWIAGTAADLVLFGPAQLLVSGHIVQAHAALALGAVVTGVMIFGTPVVQMLVLNEFREAKPLDSQTKLAWPEPTWAAAQSRGVTIPLASLHF